MTTNDLMNRVHKLLRLSESSFEAEARAALLKAQSLLQAYGMDISDLPADAAERSAPEIGDADVPTGSTQVALWQRRLMVVITKNFRCRYYLAPGGRYYSRQLRIYGAGEDVAVCREAAKFAFAAAQNGWKRYRAERLRQYGGYSPGRAYTEALKTDYMTGFVSGVARAFEAQVRAKAIVLAVPPEVDDYERTLGLRNAPRGTVRSAGDPGARRAGQHDGERSHASGQRLTQRPRLLSDR